jgi:Tfp pilus assembly protein PilF
VFVPTPTLAEFHRAEQALLEAARADPADADTAYRLVLLYHDRGRPADAVPYYQHALQLRP